VHSKASAALAATIMLVSGYGVIAAWAWPWKAALFPLTIGIPLFCLSAVELGWTLFESRARGEAKDFRKTALAAAWIIGFFAAILLLGFPLAVPLFVFLYLKVQGTEGWLFSAVFTAAVWAVFYALFDRLLHLPFAAGWLTG
jgi:Tripartite tricarboxylate transporter TctB family